MVTDLTIDGLSESDSDTLKIVGQDEVAETATLGPDSTHQGLGRADTSLLGVLFDNIESVTLETGDETEGGDTIQLSLISIPVNIDAGTQTDSLTIIADNEPAEVFVTAPGEGRIEGVGFGQITFSGVETLNASQLSTEVLNFDAFRDPNGNGPDNGQPDTFGALLNGQNLQFSVNDSQIFNGVFAGLAEVNVNGSGDDDTFTLDLSGGIMEAPFKFAGAGGRDEVRIIGSAGALTGTFVPSGTDAGKVEYTNGTITTTLEFTGTDSILDTASTAIMTVQATSSGNSISLTDGSSAGRGKVVIDNLATLEFANKPALRLEGLGGGDTFQILSSPAGLNSVTLDGGTGADKLVGQNTSNA